MAKTKEQEASPLDLSRSVHTYGLQTFRVRLPGCKVRVVDDQGRPQMQDHMDVEATSEGDAFERFKRANGIVSTIQVPHITAVNPESD